MTQVCDDAGALLGHIMIFQDITVLMETERVKDDLIKQMSHELRTPLTSIRGYAELVKYLEQNLSAQGHEFINTALNSMSVMERMVNEVVEVSVIVSNRFELELSIFDLSAALQRLEEDWQPICAARELSLSLHTPESLFIEADEEHLMQVMDHLVRNAYSYSLPGAAISIEIRPDSGWILIQVIDQGVGIAEHELERVFERLYRGTSADAGPTDARGLGLGLFISRTIVEAHSGTISLTSRVNHGTTVNVWLPAGRQINE